MSVPQRAPRPPQLMVNDEVAPHREGRSRSIATAVSQHGGKHRMSMSLSRSPARSPAPPTPSTLSQSQKLRQPFSQNSAAHQQRRSSLAAIDSGDISASIGLPYSYQQHSAPGNSSASAASAGSLSPSSASSFFPSNPSSGRPPVLNSTVPVTSRSSPRASISSLDSNYTSHSAQLRRHSESTQRRPSTAEVFDLMEREQDAIVLKLMREIQQLKDDNRSLLQTINVLTNPSSNSSARSSMSRSRRPSTVLPEDVLDMSKASLRRTSCSPDQQTPRSLRRPSVSLPAHLESEHVNREQFLKSQNQDSGNSFSGFMK